MLNSMSVVNFLQVGRWGKTIWYCLYLYAGMYIVQRVRAIGARKKIGLGKQIGHKFVKNREFLLFYTFLGFDLGF